MTPGFKRPIMRNHQTLSVHVRALLVGIKLRFKGERYRDVLSRADTHRAVKAFGRDTDDGKRDVVEIDLFADDCRIATETFLPVTMTQNSDGSRVRLCRLHQSTNDRRSGCTPSAEK